MDRKAHWEGIYRLKDPSEVSWFQAEANISFAWIRRLVPLSATLLTLLVLPPVYLWVEKEREDS